jgi:hypothetical protein
MQSRLPKAKGELIDIPKSLSEVYRNLKIFSILSETLNRKENHTW